MLPRWNWLPVLFCFFIVVQLSNGQDFSSVTTAEGNDSDRGDTTAATASDDIISTQYEESSKTAESSAAETDVSGSTSLVETTTTYNSKTTTTSAITTSTGALEDSYLYNVTVPEGQLPIEPRLTPGWGVAGVILIVTGTCFTLIGIKNRRILTFFSTGYMVALGVTVLIVYVMSVPITDAVQGAFVVAVVFSGCFLGGLSLWFKELTEGLGSALGGFCVSMWLLCLVPGGLLHPVASKAIFIACFTLVGFSFYFSRYTRDWATIVLTSFAGATVTVLGIDCFSRAGLKEFWAYVWKLNKKLFPEGANTYPITKGIRVETAAIVIVFLFGIVSQIKLWKIVREQRKRKAEERAEGQRSLEEEELHIGQQVEELNARERQEWEQRFGDGGGDAGSASANRQSETGYSESEKRYRGSNSGSIKRRSSAEVIEMSDISNQSRPRPVAEGLMATTDDMEGKVTIRVATDDVASSPEVVQEKSAAKTDQTSGEEIKRTEDTSQKAPIKQPPPPEVVPLPFKVPDEEDVQESTCDRSSVATFADDEELRAATPAQPKSLVRRLSQGSTNLLRGLSQRSGCTQNDDDGSTEGLVIPKARIQDDQSSLAATIDNESLSTSDNHSNPLSEGRKSIEITARLAGEDEPHSIAHSVSEDMHPRNSNLDSKRTDSEAQNQSNDSGDEKGIDVHKKAQSSRSAISTPASLTKDRLPQSLSRVALSYRTNEWAKHLSLAETPYPDGLHIEEAQVPQPFDEKAAPVDILDLQKAADQGAPAPAWPMTPSDSQASNISKGQPISRNSSRHSNPSGLMICENRAQDPATRSPTLSPGHTPPLHHLPRSSSTTVLRRVSSGFGPIVEERGAAFSPVPIPEEMDDARTHSTSPDNQDDPMGRSPVPGVISYSSPQTLLGQRDIFLRSRSQGSLLGNMAELNAGYHNAPSDAGSSNDYAMHPAAMGGDIDDLPLSQRKEMMRQSSLQALSSSNPALPRGNGVESGKDSSENVPFNSHQPKRISTLPTPGVREARLASFRHSVAHELRSGTPIMNTTSRDTPFASAASLLGNREADVQRNINLSHNKLLNQREAEGQRRELQRRQKEWNEQVFDERMRSGDLLDAHREAMRRLQKHAKDR